MDYSNEGANAKEYIEINLANIDGNSRVRNENALLQKSDMSSLSQHNRQYTRLLTAYVDDFTKSAVIRQKGKQDMQDIAKSLMIWVPILTCILMMLIISLLARGKISSIDILPVIITALVSLVGTFWVIPKMVTKYMFNKKEEENLASIIGKIQDYDKDIRERL